MNRVSACLWLSSGLSVLFPAEGAASGNPVETREDLIAALQSSAPGSIIRIAPGKYGGGVHVSGLKGTKESPIVIEGADPDDPPVFDGSKGGRSAIHLSGCSHVHLKQFCVTGFPVNGINIDDGGAGKPFATGIRLTRVRIEDTGPRGNHDALKLSGLEQFAISECHFAGWGGSGIDLVGCHEGTITNCRFEGRDGFSQANGIQLKGGSSRILVSKCFFLESGQRAINLGGGTGLPYFRPPDSAWEARDIEIAGNRFVGGLTPLAWVGSDNGHVHHNTIYLPEKWIGRILQENTDPRFGACRRGRFENNLVVFDRRVRVFFNIGPGTEPGSFRLHGNAWYCVDDPGRKPTGLPVEESGAVFDIDPEIRFDRDRGRLTPGQDVSAFDDIGADAYPEE